MRMGSMLNFGCESCEMSMRKMHILYRGVEGNERPVRWEQDESRKKDGKRNKENPSERVRGSPIGKPVAKQRGINIAPHHTI
jgi:hypothetical protein